MQSGNLIANPDAESSTGGTGDPTPSIPGWTTLEGAAAVIRYGTAGYPSPTSPGPAGRGANFFGGGASASSRLSQRITLPYIAQIDSGIVRFEFGGWLGGYSSQDDGVRLSVEFLSADGQPLGVVVLGPVTAAERASSTGMLERRASGTVPPGSRTARVLLFFTRAGGASNDGYADGLWLTLSVQQPNLIVNSGGEAGPGGGGEPMPTIPGWTTVAGAAAVIRYGTSGGYPSATSPGPAFRGANFFGGGTSASSRIAQDITLPYPAQIDAGTVGYEVGGWLGGYSTQADNVTLTVAFRSATGQQLGLITLGPVTPAQRGNVTGMLERRAAGTVPAGSRNAHVELLFTRKGGNANDGYADELSLTLTPGGA